jgi:two-component system CheB/CheR fusion protein
MNDPFATERVNPRPRAGLPFPVVGIGASATGVESLNALLSGLSPDTKMTFVIVQQMSRLSECVTVEDLQRATDLPVQWSEDNVPIEPGRVYLARPGHRVTVADGHLHLEAPADERGYRWAIDDFFQSFAVEQGERGIVVVLSDYGTNGTIGAQAVKAAGGLCIEQEPDSKNHPGGPRGIRQFGGADEVLKPAQIPMALSRLVEHLFGRPHSASHAAWPDLSQAERAQFTELLAVLRARTGHDFSGYKPPMVLLRIQRRMRLAGADKLGDYVSVLRERLDEALALASDLMINITGFFRDPEAWEALRVSVIRPLLAGCRSNVLRAWVAGCATGEEAYSLAILLREEIEAARRHDVEVKIFATEASEAALSFARAGVYPAGIEMDVSQERLGRFFEKGEHTYRVSRHLREMLIFAPHNLLNDPPFSRLHLCACRNLLVDLEPDSQRRVLSLFQFALREGGHLFLGATDTPSALEDGFDVVNRAGRIFRRNDSSRRQVTELRAHPLRPPSDVRRSVEISSPAARAPASLLVQKALVEQFGPPTLVVDRHDRIVYIHGRCAPYLEQPSGEPAPSLFDLLRPALRGVVRSVLRRAMSTGHVTAHASDAAECGTRVTVTAAPLAPASDPQYFRVSFESEDSTAQVARVASSAADETGAQIVRSQADVASHRELDDVIEEELRSVRRELRSTIEAYEAGNEQRQKAVEEVNSVNEELQSMNDELAAAKQQLQSVTDELLSVNGQLRARLAEVEAGGNDMLNLLASASIAVIFLDAQLTIRRFTPAISELLNVIPGDVGRPMEHLTTQFDVADLLAEARAVLDTQASKEAQVRCHSGRWYLRRTVAHRNCDDRVDGVVVSFTAISAQRAAGECVAEGSLVASAARVIA